MYFKRIIAFVVSLILVMLCTACGENKKAEEEQSKKQKIFELASSAYDNINTAYLIIDDYGSDIYDAWRMGIYEEDKLSVEYFSEKLNLSYDEINNAITSLSPEITSDDSTMKLLLQLYSSWHDMKTPNDYYFYKNKDKLFSACVWVVNESYKLNGKSEIYKTSLESAKGQMKEMSENYSDYEHYINLKGFYTKVNAYADFCENPVGSFEQVKTTLNDYRNDIRDLKNDLAYIFEE